MLGFKREVVNFLSTLCSHTTEKSPITFRLTRNSRCFIPDLLFERPEVSEMRCKHLFENLASADKISEGFTNESIQHFSKLVSIAKEKRQEFLHFGHTSESYRLDYFYMNHIGNVKCLEKLFKVLKIIFTLLHGEVSWKGLQC